MQQDFSLYPWSRRMGRCFSYRWGDADFVHRWGGNVGLPKPVQQNSDSCFGFDIINDVLYTCVLWVKQSVCPRQLSVCLSEMLPKHHRHLLKVFQRLLNISLSNKQNNIEKKSSKIIKVKFKCIWKCSNLDQCTYTVHTNNITYWQRRGG